MSERFANAPISRLVGFRVHPPDESAQESLGEAIVEIDCGPQHHNPMGRVHGGLISALADAAMGIAFGRTLLESEDFSTVEMKVSFIRPIRVGMLKASAVVIQRGLRIGFVDCRITDRRGKLIATASSTCTVLSQ
ncbi:PaaI family thioesterase [Aporhodopirellula aestuarii]|uniref:PaaI family thioesterase n=1 Tax=Aporhodopirellula aestuarii TaxID=2950107 RepID=A0ABT0U7S9_9BACT|nr:PaaI family thioesterase [Aporhodopirellula aestuarii]MCM2372473.1 PaaI family thioesterase [Aporhodopirellula aestuarii]